MSGTSGDFTILVSNTGPSQESLIERQCIALFIQWFLFSTGCYSTCIYNMHDLFIIFLWLYNYFEYNCRIWLLCNNGNRVISFFSKLTWKCDVGYILCNGNIYIHHGQLLAVICMLLWVFNHWSFYHRIILSWELKYLICISNQVLWGAGMFEQRYDNNNSTHISELWVDGVGS